MPGPVPVSAAMIVGCRLMVVRICGAVRHFVIVPVRLPVRMRVAGMGDTMARGSCGRPCPGRGSCCHGQGGG